MDGSLKMGPSTAVVPIALVRASFSVLEFKARRVKQPKANMYTLRFQHSVDRGLPERKLVTERLEFPL